MTDEAITKFYSPMMAKWNEFAKEIHESCFYGTVSGNLAAEVVVCSNEHPTKAVFEELKQRADLSNELIEPRFMLASFSNNTSYLAGNFDLSEDGRVPATPQTLPQVYMTASGLVYDAIVSGRRCIDRIERSIQMIFGKDSPELDFWKGATTTLYDNELSYALCYDLRNIVEHSFIALSTVNFNYEENVVGFAINLEAGLLQMGRIKPSLKQRLIDFYNERLANGLQPWISVAGIINSYEANISMLYFEFLLMLKRRLREWAPSDAALKEIGNYNCVVWRVANNDSYPFYSLDRVYRLQDGILIPVALENDIKKIRARLIELKPEKAEAIGDIERILLDIEDKKESIE